MTDAVDPVTRVLTGAFPFILLLAAFLTFPVSKGLLSLYTRAVRQSMRRSAARTTPVDERPLEDASRVGVDAHPAAGRAALYDLPVTMSGPGAAAILSHLMARPRRAAIVYMLAGCAYGLVITPAQMLADGTEFLPIRFSFLFWVFVWPVVLTTSIKPRLRVRAPRTRTRGAPRARRLRHRQPDR